MMTRFLRSLLVFACSSIGLSGLLADEPLKFRTDADGHYKPDELKLLKSKKKDDVQKVLQWYQLIEGQFPPDGSAHAVSGELMLIDHLERRFQIRVDRNDSQERGVWDLPLTATMLPYGSIYYLGAPAALQDIPLGTHLHGQFFLKDPNDNSPLPPGPHNNRITPESDFRRCFRIEDDFTFQLRQKQRWQIDSVDLSTNKLVATLQQDGRPTGAPKTFDLLASTRVLQGKGFADLKTLQAGQSVLMNLTWVTLYGPGRISDIWLDEDSRALATALQLERHRLHVRERGLPGWITAVDDDEQIVTITFFGGLDESLLTEWQNPDVTTGGLAVARDSLATYDPVNDRKSGKILDVTKVALEPGSSGVQIRLKMDLLLEGYRPKRIVRFYPASWKVIALPREEQFHGRE